MDLIAVKLQEAVKASVIGIDQVNCLGEIESKSRHDYVSKLDLELQNRLIINIAKILPGTEIYSEENVSEYQDIKGNAVIIDPLDGTFNAISEIPFYAISIAYIKDNIPVIGITYDIKNDEIFVGIKNLGMFVNGKKALANIKHEFSKSIAISSGFIELAARKNPKILSALGEEARIRMLGSQALQLAYVAAGRIRANINYEAKYWDDIAGYVMLNEMGFVYGDFNGQKIFPKSYIDSKENLKSFAYHPNDSEKLANILKDLI
ncbi:MAG: inositol monophosphatase [Rickettsiales bacterium]|jgi:myo-inositol-1(or 4)-monophosphatase|nr:inositol monophosphatase [Rickettsiales bacterium]